MDKKEKDEERKFDFWEVREIWHNGVQYGKSLYAGETDMKTFNKYIKSIVEDKCNHENAKISNSIWYCPDCGKRR